MPTYVYKFVKTGETIEVEQAFSDPPLTKAKHPRTNRSMSVKKVFTPVGVTFRGDGFYKTDNARSNGAKRSDGTSTSNGGSNDSSKSSTADTSSSSKSSDSSSSTGGDKAAAAATASD